MDAELLLIDKPSGITSFDVIRQLRRHYSNTHNGAKAPKMGHAGTLDPLATGLMLIGVGKGTKRLTELTKLDKEYIVEVRFGMSTTTGDLEGEIIEEKKITETLKNIEQTVIHILAELVGENMLPVSAYSAIKVDGVPMYKRARKAEKTGEVVSEVPMRTMKVHTAVLHATQIEREYVVAEVHFSVGSGAYIRSLAVEMGRLLGYPATVQNLRRTKVGEYGVERARHITDVFIDKTDLTSRDT